MTVRNTTETMPSGWRPKLLCMMLGHAHPMASEWQHGGRDRFWSRIVWCPRCDYYRPETVIGPAAAPLPLVSRLTGP